MNIIDLDTKNMNIIDLDTKNMNIKWIVLFV